MAESKSLLNLPVPRREFLKASSAAAIGIAASGLLRPGSLFAAGGAPVSLPLLGVGFTADDVAHKSVRLVDARDVLTGDPTFLSSGARLTIASFGPAESPFTLSLGSTSGTYKLQKGIYVVAFRDDAGSDGTPIWDRLTVARRGE